MPAFRPSHVLVIVNPSAGRSKSDDIGQRVVDRLAAAAVQAELRHTAADGDAERWATAAGTEGFDLVVAVGGDGTLVEVVSGVVRATKPVPVGLIPAGTANVAAQCLAIPDDLDAAMEVLAHGRLVRSDLGYVRDQDRYFVIAAAIGFPARIVRDAPREAKKRLGFLAYVVAAVRNVKRLVRPVRFEIEYDEKRFAVRSHTVVASNIGTDTGVRLEPEVDSADGKLQIAIVTSRTVRGTIRLAFRLLLRRPVDPKIVRIRTPRAKILAHPPQPIHIDGELIGTTPIVVETLPGALDFLVPLEVKEH